MSSNPTASPLKWGTASAHWPGKGRLYQRMISVVRHQAANSSGLQPLRSAKRCLLSVICYSPSAIRCPPETKQGNTLKVLPCNSPESNGFRKPYPQGVGIHGSYPLTAIRCPSASPSPALNSPRLLDKPHIPRMVQKHPRPLLRIPRKL